MKISFVASRWILHNRCSQCWNVLEAEFQTVNEKATDRGPQSSFEACKWHYFGELFLVSQLASDWNWVEVRDSKSTEADLLVISFRGQKVASGLASRIISPRIALHRFISFRFTQQTANQSDGNRKTMSSEKKLRGFSHTVSHSSPLFYLFRHRLFFDPIIHSFQTIISQTMSVYKHKKVRTIAVLIAIDELTRRR